MKGPMKQPGALTERVTFHYSESTFDPGTGQTTETWFTRADVRADVEFKSGQERALIGSINVPFRDYDIVIRFRDDIKETDTIVWDGEPLAIRSIAKMSNRQRYLLIEAELGAGDYGAVNG